MLCWFRSVHFKSWSAVCADNVFRLQNGMKYARASSDYWVIFCYYRRQSAVVDDRPTKKCKQTLPSGFTGWPEYSTVFSIPVTEYGTIPRVYNVDFIVAFFIKSTVGIVRFYLISVTLSFFQHSGRSFACDINVTMNLFPLAAMDLVLQFLRLEIKTNYTGCGWIKRVPS